MSLAAASVIFGMSCVLALVLAPVVARLARRFGFVDSPDGNRKGQAEATPLGGGLAVALAAAATLFAVIALDGGKSLESIGYPLLKGLLPAIGVLLIVGLLDDFVGLTGIYKLIGQVLATTLLIAGGVKFDGLSVFGMAWNLGDFSIPFTMFFCLGAINAFNLIDGSDALASSVGAIVLLTLGIVSAAQGDVASSALCFAMAGALAGFLSFNAPPACIYLGDTGSMLIGLIVAAVAVSCSIKRQAAFALAVPIAMCAIPILDAAAAMVRRMTTGQSVFAADRGHLHHALLHRGWSAGRTAAFISALTAVTCAGALVSYFTQNEAYALAAVGGVFVTLAATRVFGHAEMKLLANQAASLLHAANPRRAGRLASGTQNSVQIHGRRHWEKIWTALREAAPQHNLATLKLTVNIPRLHESFFATWKCNDEEHGEEGWQATLPLKYDGRPIGKLQVSGRSAGSVGLLEMQAFLEYLDPLEDQIRRLAADIAEDASAPISNSAVADSFAQLPMAPADTARVAL